MRDRISSGVATEIVTPDLGCQLAGFDARKGVAEAVHDDLHATSLVLDDGNTATVLVSIEVLGVSREFADAVRDDISHRTGIPARNVVLSATHTHCAPVTFNHFFNQGQALDQGYLDRLRSGHRSECDPCGGRPSTGACAHGNGSGDWSGGKSTDFRRFAD